MPAIALLGVVVGFFIAHAHMSLSLDSTGERMSDMVLDSRVEEALTSNTPPIKSVDPLRSMSLYGYCVGREGCRWLRSGVRVVAIDGEGQLSQMRTFRLTDENKRTFKVQANVCEFHSATVRMKPIEMQRLVAAVDRGRFNYLPDFTRPTFTDGSAHLLHIETAAYSKQIAHESSDPRVPNRFALLLQTMWRLEKSAPSLPDTVPQQAKCEAITEDHCICKSF